MSTYSVGGCWSEVQLTEQDAQRKTDRHEKFLDVLDICERLREDSAMSNGWTSQFAKEKVYEMARVDK